jgi:Ni/Co efflux regulator RcnB
MTDEEKNMINIRMTACALALAAATTSIEAQANRQSARPQPRANPDRQATRQFDDHARQVTRDWYAKTQSRPPVGFRSRDQLTPDQESRLQPGRPLPPDLRKRVHTVPQQLSRQLPPPPPNHRYVAIGGHVGMVDNRDHILRDVIHVHGGGR